MDYSVLCIHVAYHVSLTLFCGFIQSFYTIYPLLKLKLGNVMGLFHPPGASNEVHLEKGTHGVLPSQVITGLRGKQKYH